MTIKKHRDDAALSMSHLLDTRSFRPVTRVKLKLKLLGWLCNWKH